jgi:thiol-disulfide isomerase/thioredoxin
MAPPSEHPFPGESDPERLAARAREEDALLLYFTGPSCGVCAALEPKVAELLAAEFPRMAAVRVDAEAAPAAARRFQVYAVPTIVVYFGGREWVRKGRAVGLGELRDALARPYGLLFEG